MSKSATSSRTALMASAFLLLLICQIVTTAPAGYGYDNIQDLYEMLLRQGSPTQFVHQMERKGGRSPTLRLRFGRRSDPLWSKLTAMEREGGGSTNSLSDDNGALMEKVSYN